MSEGISQLENHQYESTLVNAPASQVWDLFKNFCFDQLCPSQYRSVRFIKGQPGQVDSLIEVDRVQGGKIIWKIVEISELTKKLVYQLIDSDPKISQSKILVNIRVFSDTMANRCFVSWDTDLGTHSSMDILNRNKSIKMEVFSTLERQFGGSAQAST